MKPNPILKITWGKAFDEIYGHHASLFIPYESQSLFPPETVWVGVTIRTNEIIKKKIASYSESTFSYHLKCEILADGISVPLNSSQLLDGICVDSWTILKDGIRGTHKQFPVSIFYSIPGEIPVTINFDHENSDTPFLKSEPKLKGLQNGDTIDVSINF